MKSIKYDIGGSIIKFILEDIEDIIKDKEGHESRNYTLKIDGFGQFIEIKLNELSIFKGYKDGLKEE